MPMRQHCRERLRGEKNIDLHPNTPESVPKMSPEKEYWGVNWGKFPAY